MKILLTGKPRSGKTSLFANLIDKVEAKQGLMAVEVVRAGARVGFDVIDNLGHTTPLAHVGARTPFPVGRYFVQVDNLNALIAALPEPKPEHLLYCDEIGQMQLYSSRFQQLAQDYLSCPQDFIGTVSAIYKHPFIEALHKRKDILLCTVTQENRGELKRVLTAALENRHYFNQLTALRQNAVLDLARSYLQHGHYISAVKLFKNALFYLHANRFEPSGASDYKVRGNTGTHIVTKHAERFSCDCDFFNGRGKFVGHAGECSHIQTVKLNLN